MRLWTLVISVGVHLGVAGWLVWRAKQPVEHRPTAVAMVQSKPKPKPPPKEDEAKPPPPPPPPPRPVVAAKPVAPPPTVAAPPPPAAPKSSPRPVATGLTLGNGVGSGGSGPAIVPAIGGASAGDAQPPQPLAHAERPPPPPATTPDACDEADTKPRPVGAVQVEYPDSARSEGLEGRIQVRIHVADDGAVAGVDVIEGIDPSLDAVVLSILKTWKFQPATHCGKPVPGLLAWAQRFELGD